MLKSNFDKKTKKIEITIDGDYTRLLEELLQLNIHFLQECQKACELGECKNDIQ